MIPEIKLERRNFEDMVQEYRQVISNLYPQWTNFNPHDPGMTILELFVWMKEVHSFELDQITDRHREKYLKLLGMKKHHGSPASCFIQVQPEKTGILPKGTKFFAENICFENDESKILFHEGILRCISWDQETYRNIDNHQLQYEGQMVFYPFSLPVKEGNMCYFQLGEQLGQDQDVQLTFLAAGRYQDFRKVLTPEEGKNFIPLAAYHLETYTEEGWKACSLVRDSTYGLIQDGVITFKNQGDMTRTTVDGQEGYFLRMILDKSQYETAPGCAGVGLNWVSVAQKETWAVVERHVLEQDGDRWKIKSEHCLAETGRSQLLWQHRDGSYVPCDSFSVQKSTDGFLEYQIQTRPADVTDEMILLVYEPEFEHMRLLEEGTGFPNQTIDLHTDSILYESFELLVEDSENPGHFRIWEKTDTFDASRPEDLHYRLDPERGVLSFGDGFHGTMPEGKIMIAGYSLYMGAQGNIKAGHFQNQNQVEIISHFDAAGGAGEESTESCFQRLREQLKKTDRAVTALDYETLVKQIPGLVIENCEAVAGEKLERIAGKGSGRDVGIVVKPYADTKIPVLTDGYRRNIEQYLKPRCLAGTSVRLYAPAAARISVYGSIMVKAQYYNARMIMEDSIRQFFGQQSQKFGAPVLYADLYRLLLSLDCVHVIDRLTLEGRGHGVSGQPNGDILLPPYGIAVLQDISLQIITE